MRSSDDVSKTGKIGRGWGIWGWLGNYLGTSQRGHGDHRDSFQKKIEENEASRLAWNSQYQATTMTGSGEMPTESGR